MNRSIQRLHDIMEAIEAIETERDKGKQTFDENKLIRVWMVHHLQIIGEAARAIDPHVRQKYSAVPWSDIIGMRNILVHDYTRVNNEMVWRVVTKDLPQLKTEIQKILESEKL